MTNKLIIVSEFLRKFKNSFDCAYCVLNNITKLIIDIHKAITADCYHKQQHNLASEYHTLASPAMGQWGTCPPPPSTYNLIFFSAL